jgi:hypothetical protein
MLKLLVAAGLMVCMLTLATGPGCGGNEDATRQQACEHVCGCFSFPTPQEGQQCVLSCVNNSSSATVELTSQACLNCATAAACSGIVNGTACAVECDTGSSGS